MAGAGGGPAACGGGRGRGDGVRAQLLDRREPVLSRGRECGGAGAGPAGLRRLHRGGAPRPQARRPLGYGAAAAEDPGPRAGGGARHRDREHPRGAHPRRPSGRLRLGSRSDHPGSHGALARRLRGRRARRRALAPGPARGVRLRGGAGRDSGSGKEGDTMTQRVEWLRGCATALVTPFTADGSVDEARTRALVERQIAGGVKLLVPCGTTGEGATLTAEEQTRVIRIAVEAGRGRARVIAGVGTNSTAVAIERAQAARVTGPGAVRLPLVALGADGVVSVVSNEVPDLMARLSELALQGKWDEARALHYRLLPLMEANFIESNPGPVKAAMALQGLLEETYRLPLVPVQEKTRTRLRELLQELGLLGKPRHVAA